MTFSTLLGMAFLNLWRRKVRALLTVLGMIVGTASIVVMVSLGIGSQEAFMANLAEMGSLTVINVSRYGMIASATPGRGQSVENKLDDKALNSIRMIPGVVGATPLMQTFAYVKSGKYVAGLNLAGIDMTEAKNFDIRVASGQLPDPTTSSVNNIQVVLGAYVQQEFMNPSNYRQALDANGNPLVDVYNSSLRMSFDSSHFFNVGRGYDPGLDETTPPKGKLYKVVVSGVMDMKNNRSYSTFIDINLLKSLYKDNKDFIGSYGDPKNGYEEALVKCESMDDVERISKEIQAMGYGTYSPADQITTQKKALAQNQAMLGAIGGVALLVAAIGIINTMLMSIYERTREIGIIKVVGCRMRNICEMFLFESAYIGLIGGALGLGVSYALTSILNNTLFAELGMRSIIPPYLALAGVFFAMLVAMLSGLYPSVKAMRLSPLAAIRNE